MTLYMPSSPRPDVVDLFSRRVVGSMSTATTTQLVTDALVMAIRRQAKPDALLHHSPRQPIHHEQFQRLMPIMAVYRSRPGQGPTCST
jgi:transposase InsO family protein